MMKVLKNVFKYKINTENFLSKNDIQSDIRMHRILEAE